MHKYRANYPDNESVAEKDIHKFLMTGKPAGIQFLVAKNECKHCENCVKSGENSKNGEKR